MGILDQLVEKKDILTYCDARLAAITAEYNNVLRNTPDEQKQFVIKQLSGRRHEIEYLRTVATQNIFKKKSKEMWHYTENTKTCNPRSGENTQATIALLKSMYPRMYEEEINKKIRKQLH